MKNSINLAAAILIFMVLGCACPRLGRLTGSPPPPPPPAAPSGPSAPAPSSGNTTGSSSLTMDKYNQLKTDMAKTEVERILGGPGEEISSSTGGGMTFAVYKWSGEDFKSVIVTFRQDKLMSKAQAGLK